MSMNERKPRNNDEKVCGEARVYYGVSHVKVRVIVFTLMQ